MHNHWLNKPQAKASGKPCLVPRQVEVNGEWVWEGKWVGAPEPVADILLTYTRCKILGCPVGDREKPVAYVYKQSERSQFRYVPFYARFIEQIDMSNTTELEAKVLSRRRGDGIRSVV
ncbi:hypothetical protein D3C76_1413060 [compost metagenome]